MLDTLLNVIAIFSFILSIIQTYITILDHYTKQQEKREKKKKAYLDEIKKALDNDEAYSIPSRKDKP